MMGSGYQNYYGGYNRGRRYSIAACANATPVKQVASAMRFVVRRYDSVPAVDQIHGSDPELDQQADGRGDRVKSKLLNGDVTSGGGGRHHLNENILTVQSAGSDEANESATSLNTIQGDDVNTEMNDVVLRGRVFAKRQRRRLVCKNGEINIVKCGVSQKRRRFVIDIFTTILEVKWRFLLLLFAAGFVISWLIFALFWWIVVVAHEDHLHKDDPDWHPCMGNVYDFPTALLFSIETQHTIGYGFRVMEPKCPEAMLLLMVQSCLGVFIQSLLTGLIFAKLSRPKKRAQTIMFSKNAVICQRDGEMCLVFRLADMRKTHIVAVTIRAVLVRNRLTKEGELIPLCSEPLKVEAETMIPDDNFVFLAWPVSVVHTINSESPLYDISLEQLLQTWDGYYRKPNYLITIHVESFHYSIKTPDRTVLFHVDPCVPPGKMVEAYNNFKEKFEIVTVLEGTIEATGMTAQLRSSYLPSEILWGHHLAPLVTYQKENGNYKIDYTQFHSTIPITMAEYSARDFNEKKKESKKNNNDIEDRRIEPDYPCNFTAPAFRPQKRSWSFRAKGSIKGSIRRKGGNNNSLKQKGGGGGAGGLPSSSLVGANSGNIGNGVLHKVASPCPSTSRCNSLQSVAEQEPGSPKSLMTTPSFTSGGEMTPNTSTEQL